MSLAKTLHMIQDCGAIAEMARRSGGGKLGDQLRPQVRCPDVSGAFSGLLLFDMPVGEMHETLPRWIAGIRPAETEIEQILERIPHGAACRAGRIDIEAAQGPVGPRNPARHCQINLEPAEMRVRRGKYWRSKLGRDAGKGDFGPKPHRKINRAACRRIARVERGDIDIFASEGHYGRPVFQLAGRHANGSARQRRIAHQDFRHRIAVHHHDAMKRRLGHSMGRHVFHDVLRRRPLGILRIFGKAHQHGGAPLSRAPSRTTDHGIATCRNARSIAKR